MQITFNVEKTTNPTNGWWWTLYWSGISFMIVFVFYGKFHEAGRGSNIFATPIDGIREFWGPIPEFDKFVPPADPYKDSKQTELPPKSTRPRKSHTIG